MRVQGERYANVPHIVVEPHLRMPRELRGLRVRGFRVRGFRVRVQGFVGFRAEGSELRGLCQRICVRRGGGLRFEG